MLDLDALLERPDLAAGERLLIAAEAAIWPGDWERVAQCAQRARERGEPRARFEEMLLQAVLFFGFPRAITAFETLARCWPQPAAPVGGSLPDTEQADAGRALFASIYGRNTNAVRATLRGFHGELHDFVLDAAYGRILTRPGLPAALRELLAVGALAVSAQIPQLVAHGRGAIALGASAAAVREAIVTAIGDAGRAEELMRRVGKR